MKRSRYCLDEDYQPGDLVFIKETLFYSFKYVRWLDESGMPISGIELNGPPTEISETLLPSKLKDPKKKHRKMGSGFGSLSYDQSIYFIIAIALSV